MGMGMHPIITLLSLLMTSLLMTSLLMTSLMTSATAADENEAIHVYRRPEPTTINEQGIKSPPTITGFISRPTADEWIHINGIEYKHFQYTGNFLEARNLCAQHNSTLPEPRTVQQNLALGRQYPVTLFFLGLSRNKDGNWVWSSDGSKVHWFDWRSDVSCTPGFECTPPFNCAIMTRSHDSDSGGHRWWPINCENPHYPVVCQRAIHVYRRPEPTTVREQNMTTPPTTTGCFTILSERAETINKARSMCEERGWKLPEPKNVQDHAELANMAVTHWFPLGISDSEYEGHWVYDSDGSNVTYDNWKVWHDGTREPSGGRYKNCAGRMLYAFTQSGDWQAMYCDYGYEDFPVVCETTVCSPGFTQLGDKCYKFSDVKKTFHAAQAECERQGANLAMPDNAEEDKHIKALVNAHDTVRTWIGGTDEAHEGTFISASTGEVLTFTDWAPGDPNNALGGEDCTVMVREINWSWYDDKCDKTFNFVCQKAASGLRRNGTINPHKMTSPPPVYTTVTSPPPVYTTVTSPPRAYTTQTYRPPVDVYPTKPIATGRYTILPRRAEIINQARSMCEKRGWKLPEPKNSQDNTELENLEVTTWFPLGISDRKSEGTWVYDSDGSNVTYVNWVVEEDGAFEPSGGSERNCAMMLFPEFWSGYSSGRWRDWVCDDQVRDFPVVCDTTACNNGFTRLSDHCYRHVDDSKTWDDAQAECQTMGAFLAEPETREENINVRDLVQQNGGGDTWLGATDQAVEGRWIWATSMRPVSFTDWIFGKPNNAHDEDCLQFKLGDEGLQWNDIHCWEKFSFVCQHEMNGRYTILSDRANSINEARSVCKEAGMKLPEPKTAQDNTQLLSLLDGDWIFLGISDFLSEGTWVYDSDGSNVTYVDWMVWYDGTHEPNGGGDQNCAAMSSRLYIADVTYGSWWDYPCDFQNFNNFPVVCETTEQATPVRTHQTTQTTTAATVQTTVKQTMTSSTPELTTVNSTTGRYTILSDRANSINEARSMCKEAGMKLPEPKTSQDNTQLANLGVSDGFPLGISDSKSEGTWVYDSDGSNVTYVDWMVSGDVSHEPNGGRRENCAATTFGESLLYNGTGNWWDYSCDFQDDYGYSVVCETSGRYTIFPSRADTINEARSMCKEAGLKLPEPKTYLDKTQLQSLGDGDWVPLGISDSKLEGTWVYDSDGSNVTYVDWLAWHLWSYEPNGGRRENCVVMRFSDKIFLYGGSGSWWDYSCDVQSDNGYLVVCETSEQTTPVKPTLVTTDQTTTRTSSPPGYTTVTSSSTSQTDRPTVSTVTSATERYTYFANRASSINEARSMCKKAGLKLPEPKHPQDNTQLLNLVDGYWLPLGISDSKSEGTWVYDSDGSNVTYVDWMVGSGGSREPNGGRDQNCAVIILPEYNIHDVTSGSWWDYSCDVWVDYNFPVVCETTEQTTPVKATPVTTHQTTQTTTPTTVQTTKMTSSSPELTTVTSATGQSGRYTILSDGASSINEARSMCKEAGMKLPEPKTPQDDTQLLNLEVTNWFPLGMSYSTSEGTWVYNSDGSNVTYANWKMWHDGSYGSYQPNGGRYHKCAVMTLPDHNLIMAEYTSGGWRDYSCDDQVYNTLPVVCETPDALSKDKLAPGSSPWMLSTLVLAGVLVLLLGAVGVVKLHERRRLHAKKMGVYNAFVNEVCQDSQGSQESPHTDLKEGDNTAFVNDMEAGNIAIVNEADNVAFVKDMCLESEEA